LNDNAVKIPPKNGAAKKDLFHWRRHWEQAAALVNRRPWLLALAVSLFVSLLIAPPFTFSLKGLEVGQFANRAIKADRDFDVEDASSTHARREEAAAAVLPIYDHDAQIDTRQIQHITEAFQTMRAFYVEAEKPADGAPGDEQVGRASILPRAAAEEQRKRFQQTLGAELEERSLEYLRREQFSKEIEQDVIDLARYALTRLVVNNRQVLMDQIATLPGTQAIAVRELGSNKVRTYSNFSNVLDLSTVLAQVEQRSREQIDNPQRRAVVVSIARKLIRPT
jgi:membrane-associated HD superfamily phosphohydrolase